MVQDNGKGFDERAASGGIGLDGLRERLEVAGGVFSIHTNAAHGTILTAQLPLPVGWPLPEEA